MLNEVYKAKVNLILDGKGLGKPFFVDTDARQKETYKHSKNYFDDLLSSINGQATKLKTIISGCNNIKMTERCLNSILKDIRLAVEAAAAHFTFNN